MPNIKSAKKRVNVIAAKSMENKAVKSNLKTVLKNVNVACESGENKAEAVKLAIKKVDQACAKGLMHKNKAARLKSGLACKLSAKVG